MSVRRIAIGREVRTFGEWCRHFGASESTVRARLRAGESMREALSRPPDAPTETRGNFKARRA